MNSYIEKLRQYVAANPIRFDDNCDYPALDSLYWHYSEYHNMSNANTRAVSRALNEYLSELSFQENDRVFSLVNTLCSEYERIAFLAGLQLGAQMMLELTEDSAGDKFPK